jgi:NAD/NADP transhydrogenase beta subunit
MNDSFWQAAYIIAALCVVFSIKWLSSPVTARKGVLAGEFGMLLAVIGTLLRHEVVSYEWIAIAFVAGAAVGAPLAYLMPMTSVPQLTALSHAFGALAAALVGSAEYYTDVAAGHPTTGFKMVALVIESLLGYLTTTASVMAFGKLQEIVPTRLDDCDTRSRLGLPGVYRVVAPFWNPPDHAHWRRRHAHGDRAAKLLRGRGLRCDGFRAGEPPPHHRRRAERVLWFHSLGDHVQGHEPLVH